MTLQYSVPDVLIHASAELGEGPVWVERDQRLSWVDLTQGVWHLSDISTGESDTVEIGGLLGAVVPSSDGGWVAVVDDGFLALDAGRRRGREVRSIPQPNLRSNDAKCDSRGRLWAGSVDRDFRAGLGALHRLDHDWQSAEKVSGLTQPNGLGWSPDDDLFYLIDTRARQLLEFQFDAEEGELGKSRALNTWDPSFEPDGLTVDADGCIWVAMWDGGVVHRYSPQGTLIGSVPCPVSKPTSCAILPGGTLVITSAGIASNPVSEPHAGSVFALDVGVEPVPVAPFAVHTTRQESE